MPDRCWGVFSSIRIGLCVAQSGDTVFICFKLNGALTPSEEGRDVSVHFFGRFYPISLLSMLSMGRMGSFRSGGSPRRHRFFNRLDAIRACIRLVSSGL
jgi:hypothetical protein